MITRILPGTSVDVVAGERSTELGVVGVVTMAQVLSWGGKVTTIRQGDSTLTMLGYKMTDAKLKLVNEAMKSANKLVLYRLNTGTKAAGTLATGITATAKYGGALGNSIKVTVAASDTNWVIKTFLGTTEMDSQIVSAVSKFSANDFIEIDGTGTLEAATIALTGGADGTADEGAWDAYKAELEKQDYNIIAYTGTDSTEAQGLIDFVNEQRANDVNVQLVQSVVDADDIAVYKSTVGGVTTAYSLTAAEACATMAGILAKCGIVASATYFDVPWWADVSTRLTKVQQETKTLNGEILFVLMHSGVKVLYDINSLKTYTDEKPEDFHKGLVIRTLDKYATDLKILLDTKAIGKIRNTVAGRNQIKGYIVDMTKVNYLDKGYIEGFTADDVTVSEGTSRDSVIATSGIRVADTVDKIYMTVTAL